MIYIEMTGSPKQFGFKTKAKYMEALGPFGVKELKLNHGAHYLITNDLSSNTLKMKTAKKLRVKIRTYGDFLTEFKELLRAMKIHELKKKMKI